MTAKAVEMAVPQTGLRARFLHGITWNVVNALFTQGSVFLSNVIIANLLGREIFGEYGMIQSTLLTVSGIAQVATGITATKYVAEYRSTDKEKTGRILGLCSTVTFLTGCVATLLLLVGAPWLASHTLRAPHLSRGIMISAGVVMFAVVNGYQAGALAGLEGYRILARAGIFQGALHLAVCSLGAWFWGLEGALAGLVASAAGRWLLYHGALRTAGREHAIFLTYRGLWRERRIILGFAVPAALCGFTSMPAIWLANAFLVRQEGGYSQMGLYSAANTLRILTLAIPLLFNNVGSSLLNNQLGQGNDRLYRKVFWINSFAMTGTVVVGFFLMALGGSWVLGLFGKDFVAGYPILLCLILSAIPEALAVAFFQVIQSRERMWLSLLFVNVPRDLVMVGLAYFFIPRYGAMGMAASYLASWCVALVAIITIIYRCNMFVAGREESVASG